MWTTLISLLYLSLVSWSNAQQSYNVSGFPSLIDITIDQVAVGLESGRFTSFHLVKAYLTRISEVNPQLNIVTETNPDALAIAQNLDDERANGTIRGPLHGIPILIKDNIATMDKMNNTGELALNHELPIESDAVPAGSYALLGATVPRDSAIAAKLRQAGVVILGKSNLSQWSEFRSNNSSEGWSAYGGQVYGAYYPDQNPNGSSSGSGVGTSIGATLAAIGTETSGSLLYPSAANNVVGIKPTVGLTSRALVIPLSQRLDSVGTMARTVKDAAYLLSAIAGKDPDDNYTSAIPFDNVPDYTASCILSGLDKVRVGIPRNAIQPDNTTADILTAFETAIQAIRKAGATIVDNANFSAYSQYLNDDSLTTVIGADFVSDLPSRYLSKLVTNPQNVHNVSGVSNFTHKDPLEDFPDRNTAEWHAAMALGFNNTAPQFWAAYQACLFYGGSGGVLGALEKDNLDVLILPTYISPLLPALVGYPVVTVPLGFYSQNQTVIKSEPREDLVKAAPNVPFGISFIGRPWSEQKLISLAYAFEQRTNVRNKVQPYIVPNTELADIVGAYMDSYTQMHPTSDGATKQAYEGT